MDTPANNVPNFDAMEPTALFDFWARHQTGRDSRALFPEGGKGTRRATADLANYASNIGTAKTLRLRGQIARSLDYERIADCIYQGLPNFARW